MAAQISVYIGLCNGLAPVSGGDADELDNKQGPLLLTWINFNLSMDK